MSVPRKLLIDGEDIVLSLHTHVKALIVPAVVLIVLVGIGSYLTAVLASGRGSDGAAGWVLAGVWAAAAVAIVGWAILPFLRWRTTEYTVTTKRVLYTSGLLSRTGRAMPLSRVNDVTFEKGLVDRLLGCGTLVVSDASEQTGMRLHDVPRVEAVHRRLTDLNFGGSDGLGDDGTGMPGGR
jgi:membrane protein YdbS with pleckstrin-like domain